MGVIGVYVYYVIFLRLTTRCAEVGLW